MTVSKTNIVWTDYSGNHWVGCAKVSGGCRNCWAADMADRYDRTPKPWTIDNAPENVQVYDEDFASQLAGVQGAWVFSPSASDPFLPWLPTEAYAEWFEAIRETPWNCYQVLTKWGPESDSKIDVEWPENVILGVTVESPRRTYRIDWLREQDAAMKFISFEPLIEKIEEVDLTGIDWMIVGGESKQAADGRREMEPEWARRLYEISREQDVAYLFKQHSGQYPEQMTRLYVDGLKREIHEFPETPESVPDAPEEFL